MIDGPHVHWVAPDIARGHDAAPRRMGDIRTQRPIRVALWVFAPCQSAPSASAICSLTLAKASGVTEILSIPASTRMWANSGSLDGA